MNYQTPPPIITPSTVPSIAELHSSSGSSSEASSDGALTKVLFQSPTSVQSPRMMIRGQEMTDNNDDDEDDDILSDSSLASRPGTLGIASTKANLTAKLEMAASPTTGEESRRPNACYPNLSPKELASVFSLFHDAKQYWPTTEEILKDSHTPETKTANRQPDTPCSSTVTEVTSNVRPGTSNEKKVEVLERECRSLKDVVKADAITIMTLKHELVQLKARTRPVTSTLKHDYEKIRSERDSLLERDGQHQETIRILKDEVNHLAHSAFAEASKTKQVEQLKLENHLFASQIVEYEQEMNAMREIIKSFQGQELIGNELATPTKRSRGPVQTPETETTVTSSQGGPSPTGKNPSIMTLNEKVTALTVRMEAIEQARMERESTKRSDSSRRSNGTFGYEIGVDGRVIGDPPLDSQLSPKEKAGWKALCDCLLTSRVVESEE